MIIAIDGPAGAGKSTVARAVARELGLAFLDTGAMYRAVTLVALRRGVALGDEEACARLAGETRLDFDPESRILIDGEPGEPTIRGQEVTAAVSEVSAHAAVRRAVVARQRELASGGPGVVAEGRDTATVVFPDADHKFFLIATARERARRRAAELGQPEREDEIRRAIEARDAHDTERAHSPLKMADGARVIDTEGLEPDEVVARILEAVDGRTPEAPRRLGESAR